MVKKGKGRIQLCAVGEKSCDKPDGTVVWVFCDACEGWFHCPCVNVDSKKATDEDFIFVCKGCKPQKEKVTYLIKQFRAGGTILKVVGPVLS